MAVGGETDPGRIDRRHWEQAATDLGMRPRFVVDEVRRLAEAIDTAHSDVRKKMEAEHGPLPMVQQPEAVARTQVRLARNALG